MKKIVALLCFVVVLIAVTDAANTRSNPAYTTKYDGVDVDRILQNGRVLTNYIKCMLDEGNCSPEGRELKKTLPDALVSDCEKCNPKQKATATKIINHLREKRPGDWKRLRAKYDPEGRFEQRYEEAVKSKTK